MSETSEDKPDKDKQRKAKDDRVAQALRDNLRRRKTAARKSK